MGPSEHILVWRLRRGDWDACRELIGRHHQGVYGYLRRLGADATLAEDLTQETYAKAWRGIRSLRKPVSLRSWLLTIARNEFFQWMRRSRPEVSGVEETQDREDDHPGADSTLMRDERDRLLRRAVTRLEPPLQETVALHYFQDLSIREVGAVLGVPAGTVKSRLHRALGSLRAVMEHKEADHERSRAEKALAGRS